MIYLCDCVVGVFIVCKSDILGSNVYVEIYWEDEFVLYMVFIIVELVC